MLVRMRNDEEQFGIRKQRIGRRSKPEGMLWRRFGSGEMTKTVRSRTAIFQWKAKTGGLMIPPLPLLRLLLLLLLLLLLPLFEWKAKTEGSTADACEAGYSPEALDKDLWVGA